MAWVMACIPHLIVPIFPYLLIGLLEPPMKRELLEPPSIFSALLVCVKSSLYHNLQIQLQKKTY